MKIVLDVVEVGMVRSRWERRLVGNEKELLWTFWNVDFGMVQLFFWNGKDLLTD